MAEHKLQGACRDLLGHLLHQTLRHILHHYWMQRKHRSCFPSFQQGTPPERPERLQELLPRERGDAFLDQVSERKGFPCEGEPAEDGFFEGGETLNLLVE